MITSKTRVAPVNMKTTIPRLELCCGAVLLANLLTRTVESLQIKGIQAYARSDSTATLGWLRGDTNRWKTFVANRVSEVKANAIGEWNYVASEDNPADCASRRIMPHELKNHSFWWQGPKWLKNDPSTWKRTNTMETSQEIRKIVTNTAAINTREELAQASKLVRIIAYCLRMKTVNRQETTLTLENLNEAKTVLYKRCQQESFPAEVINLQHKKPIPRKSKLITLVPFLDDKGIMRDNQHPIILPQSLHVTKLIVRQIHLDTLHGGPQLMVNLLRKRYWILQAKRLANNEYKECVVCRRHKGRSQQQIMRQLPQDRDRVMLERAFLHTGIEIKSSKLRKAKIQKGYAWWLCL